ncbi:Gamma-glutamyltranspeptidase [Moraxella catarrhalis]|nr:Gamma-glutamyltranspeptidase [Moraxella catarrhalis]
MVASANPLATQAGYDILKQGGSAADDTKLGRATVVRLGWWCICVVLGQYRQNIDHI